MKYFVMFEVCAINIAGKPSSSGAFVLLIINGLAICCLVGVVLEDIAVLSRQSAKREGTSH